MLSRIVSVRYSPLTTVSRGRPCATASRPSHLSSRALVIAWLGVRAQAGAQAAPVRADDAQAAQAAPASLPRRFGQDDARRHTASWAELRYALLPSLSVLGAAEAFTGGSVRTQLIALAGMTLATSAPQHSLSFDTSCFPRFLCLERQRLPLAAQCVRS